MYEQVHGFSGGLGIVKIQGDKCTLGLHFVDFFFRVPLCYLANGPILPYLQLPYLNLADCGTFKRSQQNVVPNYICHPVHPGQSWREMVTLLVNHPKPTLATKYASIPSKNEFPFSWRLNDNSSFEYGTHTSTVTVPERPTKSPLMNMIREMLRILPVSSRV